MAFVGTGDTFGKYRLLSLLGRGGAGAVYVAEDETLGRCVALKVLDRALTRLDSFEGILRREARLIASIEHPHIVRIHSLERVGEDLAIDMAYMRGGSLAEALRAGALPPVRAVTSALEVLSALARCHEAGVVHRDVKPGNILLDEGGRSLLSDFGLAKLLSVRHAESLSASTSSEFFVGTPRYAPPEAWDGAEPAPAWDVYSMGMVLYEAITGKTPYDARAPFAYVKQLMERPAPRIDPGTAGVSPELCDAVSAMLEREVSARPQDGGAALELLRRAPEYAESQHREAVTSRGTIALPRRRRRMALKPHSWRKPALVSAVVAVILLASAGLYSAMDAAVPAASTAGGGRVFDTLDLATGTALPGHMLGTPGAVPGESTLVAAESTRLWFLHNKALDAATISYDGHWAEYGDPSARVFRHGTVSGTGRIASDGKEVLSLRFVSLQDGSRWDRSLIKTVSETRDAAGFAAELMSAEYIQPLVYDELLPRRLEWAVDLEAGYLCTPEGVIGVPAVAPGTVRIDGILDESAWSGGRVGVAGNVLCTGNRSACMLLRYDEDALYIGIRCANVVTDPQVRLALLNRYSLPLSASPQWLARFDGGALAASTRRIAGNETAWNCPWESAASIQDKAWEMEVRVPYASLGEEGKPLPEVRWRVSGSVVEPSSKRKLATWGGEADRADTGMIVVFASQDNP